MFCFVFHISVPIVHYSCHITEAEGEVGYRFKPPSVFIMTVQRGTSVVFPYYYFVLDVCIYTLVQLLC